MSDRPSDWSPVAGSDPCPGSVPVVQDLAQWWYDAASAYNTAAGSVVQGGSVVGRGVSVDRINTVLSEFSQALEVIHGQYVGAGDAVRGWARELESLQGQSAEVLARAKEAQSELDEVNYLLSSVGAQLSTMSAGVSAAGGESGTGLGALLEQRYQQVEILRAQQYQLEQRQMELLGQLRWYREQTVGFREQYLSAADRWGRNYQVILPDVPVIQALRSGGLSGSWNVAGVLLGSHTDFRALEAAFAHANTREGAQRVLNLLAQLSPDDVRVVGLVNRDVFERPLAVVTDKNSDEQDLIDLTAWTTTWWAGLDEVQQKSLVQYLPGLIGNLDGVSYVQRDRANRYLLQYLDQRRAVLNPDEREAIDNIKAALLISGDDYFKVNNERSLARLWLSGPSSGRILAGVGVGDLDQATDMDFVVPGIRNWTSNSMAGLTDNATNVRKTMNDILRKHQVGGRDVATMALIGYDAPDVLQEPVTSYARNGAPLLARTFDTYQAYRERSGGGPVRVGVLAHSYGTTTLTLALQHTVLPVHSVVMLGSAGIPAAAAVPPGEVDLRAMLVQLIGQNSAGLVYTYDLKVDESDGHANIFVSQSHADWTASVGKVSTFDHQGLPSLVLDSHVFSSDGGTIPDGQDQGERLPEDHGHQLTNSDPDKLGYLEVQTVDGKVIPVSSLYNSSVALLDIPGIGMAQ